MRDLIEELVDQDEEGMRGVEEAENP